MPRVGWPLLGMQKRLWPGAYPLNPPPPGPSGDTTAVRVFHLPLSEPGWRACPQGQGLWGEHPTSICAHRRRN